MRVLVTGASGYIGFAISENLAGGGHRVLGTARSAASSERLRAAGFEPVFGDLDDPASLAAATRSADAVIHAASAGGSDEYAVGAMLEAMAGSGKAFVYTSGVWVLGDTKGRVAAEMWPLRPPAVVAWRPAVEQLVLESAGRGVKPTVIRPAMVYGRGGGVVGDFVRQARREGVVRYAGDGENHWSFVHADGLATLYRLVIEQEPAGEIFLAADGPTFQVKTVTEAAAWAGGARGKTDGLPLEEARKVFGPAADALVMDQRIMSTKAGRMLGWDPRYPSVLDDIMRGSYVEG